MKTVGDSSLPIHGVAAEFVSATELAEAARAVRAAGYRKFDVFSPFPIHGMDKIVGQTRSPLGKIIFVGGTMGFLTAVGLQFIPSTFIYPLVVAGKPTGFFTLPAFFPIMFELTILFSALTAFFGLLIMNGLPRWHHPMLAWEDFKRVSADRFFVVIESDDPKFSAEEIERLYGALGGQNITVIHEE